MSDKQRTPKTVLSLVISLLLGIMATIFAYSAKNPTLLGKVVTSSSPLNVRSEGKKSGEIVSCLERSSYVRLLSKKGDWWKVEYEDGKFGWCHSRYIRQMGEEQIRYVNTNGSVLNVRKGKSTETEISDTLLNGSKVRVIKDYGKWSKVTYADGKTGYVYDKYLSKKITGKYSPVKLDAVLYRQTDSRWADTTLGGSSKTIATCGCTTSCLAMSESFLNKTDIFPDDMEKRLSYSESGSLYWPSHYATSTEEETWKQEVYRSLCAGIPVIIGAEQASGRQHWVLITGYDGASDGLYDSGFLINDPSTAERSRLDEFFDDYPYFLKIAYFSSNRV